jgi:hypothetical protein
MKATYSSETLVNFQQTTLRCIQEDRPIHNHRFDNLRFSQTTWYNNTEYSMVHSRKLHVYKKKTSKVTAVSVTKSPNTCFSEETAIISLSSINKLVFVI